MNDPHASLSLFQPRDVTQEESYVSQPMAARAQSAKPPPREYSELFVGENAGSPSPSPQRIPVKSGGGKNYKANRLFEDADDDQPVPTPKSVKTNAKKYNHFEFGDGDDTPKVRDTARAKARGKQETHWEFEDFVTPHKVAQRTQPQAVRHFGWSDDEVGPLYQTELQGVAPVPLPPTTIRTCTDVTCQQEEVSPVRRPVVHKARPDADPHFDFVDESTSDGQRKVAPTKGSRGNKGQGLYEDHVTNTTNDEDDSSAKGDVKRALNDVTTAVKNENRSKDFGAHWEMNDNSPALNKNGGAKLPSRETRKAMNTHWGEYQDSPEGRGINIAGNGMGGRKTNEPAWSLFDESPAKKENAPNGSHAGIKTTGDGMGGRKNADSFWDF